MGASTLLSAFNKILGKITARIQRNWRTQRTFKEHFPEKRAHFFTLLCRKTSQNSFLNLLSPISLPYSLSCSKQIFASITVLKQSWSSSPMTFMFLNPMVQYPFSSYLIKAHVTVADSILFETLFFTGFSGYHSFFFLPRNYYFLLNSADWTPPQLSL